MKKILDWSVGGNKQVSELDGGYFSGSIDVMTEKNASSVMNGITAYSNPRFSKIERFIIGAGKEVFVEYLKPGYGISGNGLREFRRVDGSTVMINMSNVCMVESFWLAEFNYQCRSGLTPKAVLIRDKDETVREMLKTGNID